MLNLVKKQTVGNWLTLAVLVLSIISVIVYGTIGSMPGQFEKYSDSSVIVMSVFAVIAAAGVLVLSNLSFEGVLGTVMNVLTDILKIVAAVLLIASLMQFLSGVAEGLAFIYGSDEEAKDAAQTPENLAAGKIVITAIVFYAISFIPAVVAAFMSFAKKDKKEAAVAV